MYNTSVENCATSPSTNQMNWVSAQGQGRLRLSSALFLFFFLPFFLSKAFFFLLPSLWDWLLFSPLFFFLPLELNRTWICIDQEVHWTASRGSTQVAGGSIKPNDQVLRVPPGGWLPPKTPYLLLFLVADVGGQDGFDRERLWFGLPSGLSLNWH